MCSEMWIKVYVRLFTRMCLPKYINYTYVGVYCNLCNSLTPQGPMTPIPPFYNAQHWFQLVCGAVGKPC